MLDAKMDYWRAQLAGVDPVLELPTDRPRPAARTPRGAVEHAVFPPALRDRLKAVGREADATLFMTLLAAFAVLLARYSGRDDVVVGSPTAGRRDVELENLIGFFVNTLVLRTDLSGDPTFRELLARVRERDAGRLRPPGGAVREARRRPARPARASATRRSSR